MLPRYFALYVQNELGANLDLSGTPTDAMTITYRMWRPHATDGTLEWSNETTVSFTSADIADGAGAQVCTVDNRSTEYWGLHGTWMIDSASASHTDDAYLSLEFSTDDGSSWPSDEAGFSYTTLQHLCTISDPASTEIKRNFIIE